MRYFIYFFIVLLTTSCSEKASQNNETQNTEVKSEFVMYEMSEMASLMEQMFVENTRLRDKIIANEFLGEMPEYFQGILDRKLTDPSDKDQFYIEHANLFLAQQNKIYSNPDQAKNLFNASVDACIKCHEVKCGGPIQRIKKLYIK